MGGSPIDIQVNVAQSVEVSRVASVQAEASSTLQAALSHAGVKEADRQRGQVQPVPEDQTSQAVTEEGTGRGRAFLRQQGEKREGEPEEEAGAQEPGKGGHLDLKG